MFFLFKKSSLLFMPFALEYMSLHSAVPRIFGFFFWTPCLFDSFFLAHYLPLNLNSIE
jgi:hypothetical protein